ncbi:hypothetical protein G6F63_016988 [Rhizopus arrhizus]|nr:hypothetical protein G6F63_016988 [Rhizopus arrhizus]
MRGSGIRAGGDRGVWLRAPFAPRARIQGRARQPRHLHGKQIVARRDAGAALADDVGRRAAVHAQHEGLT